MDTDNTKYILDKYISGFDIIYWINLDRAEKRRENMKEMLDLIPIDNIRIKAVDGNFDNPYDKLYYYNSRCSKSEYGCLVSHLETINKFSRSNYEIALILEDDMNLEYVQYWNKSIADIIKNAPIDWDIIMLTYINCNSELHNTYTLNDKGEIWGAGAYLINKKSALNFINKIYNNNMYILNKNLYQASDIYIFKLLKTYTYKYPYFIYPDDNNSFIHPDHLNKHQTSKNELTKIWSSTINKIH